MSGQATGALIVKRWDVTVVGYGTGAYDGASRGKALADAWRSDAFNGYTYRQFLSIANCRKGTLPDRWGDHITVCGKPAFFLESNRAYVRFAYPDCGVVSNAHPFDVEPEEYRPDTYRNAREQVSA